MDTKETLERNPEKASAKPPEKRRGKKRKRRFKTLMFFLFWLFIIASFGVLTVSQANNYNNLRADLLDIETRILAEQAVIEDLDLQIMFFDSDAHVEQLARERLGMVRTDEIVFRNIASGN